MGGETPPKVHFRPAGNDRRGFPLAGPGMTGHFKLKKPAIRGRVEEGHRMASKAKTRTKTTKTVKTRKHAKTSAKTAHAVVPGSPRPPTKGATRIKDAPSNSNVEVTMTLRGPKLPGAHLLLGRALSAADFKANYSASKRDADKVSTVLRKFGLRIEDVSLETRSMRVSGSVAQMEAAFHPNLGIYQSADQGEFRDRESDYKIPDPLRGIVTAIIGFGERRV